MWKYTNNQFEVATERNFKKGYILSNYHNAALKKAKENNPNDAVIDNLYTRYNPLAAALATAFQEWKLKGGEKQASTLNLDQLLATLPTKMNVWEPAIQTKFAKTTPEFKAILPNGRSGLTRGGREDKISNLKAFAKSIDKVAELATIKSQIDAFCTLIDNARQSQLGNKSQVEQGSEALAQAVKDCMVMQYRNLGVLMDKYYHKTDIIESFFDLVTLQESLQTTFTGTLDPQENEAILIHTFMPGDELRIKIAGNGAARFYLSNTPNGLNSELVQVAPNVPLVIDVAEFNVPDFATYRYLTALNPSTTETLRYEVEVL